MPSIFKPIVEKWKINSVSITLFKLGDGDELRAVVSGTGALTTDDSLLSSKWSEYEDRITELLISDAITYVDASLFKNATALSSISIYNDIRATVTGVLKAKAIKKRLYSDGQALYLLDLDDRSSSLLLFAKSSSNYYKLPLAIQLDEIVYPLTSISENAFFASQTLSEIKVSGSVSQICAYAFSECKALTSVLLPQKLSVMGKAAFFGCSLLENIHLPSTLECIPEYAFCNCNSLIAISFSEGVCTIGANAFQGCSSLTRVELPSTLKKIEDQAFCDCTGIFEIKNDSNINLKDGEPSNGEIAKYAINIYSSNIGKAATVTSDGYVFVKKDGIGLLVRYTGEESELKLPSAFPEPNSSDTSYQIAPNAFADCSGIISIELPDCVKVIGEKAFENCVSLERLNIGNGVQSLPCNALSGCASLKTLIIGSGLKKLDVYALSDCTSLKDISVDFSNARFSSDGSAIFESGASGGCTLIVFTDLSAETYTVPDKIKFGYSTYRVTSIGRYAFSEIRDLSTVNISKNVTSISEAAFYKCPSLSDVVFSANAKKWSYVNKHKNWVVPIVETQFPKISFNDQH